MTVPRVLAFDYDAYVSGGQRSFLALLSEMQDRGYVTVTALVGAGATSRAFEDAGFPTRATQLALPKPSTSIPELRAFVVTLIRLVSTVRRTAGEEQADLVHANSIRAGIVAVMAHWLGGPPVVVHIRDNFRRSAAAILGRVFILSTSASVLAVSGYTARRFEVRGLQRVTPVHNAIRPDSFQPLTAREMVRSDLGDGGHRRKVLGVVAQLTPWKAQDDAIRILAGVRAAGIDAVLWLVGEVKRPAHMSASDADAYEAELHDLAERLGVEPFVRFLGQRSDMPDVMGAIDVLMIPSWREPFARTLIEAMTVGTPAVVTSASGMGEVVVEGETGFLRPPRRPDVWAEIVLRLCNEDHLRAKVARAAAKAAAERFSPARQAREVSAVYWAALHAWRPPRRWRW